MKGEAMREIDKMTQLREQAENEAEKQAVSQAMDVLHDAFHQMIFATGAALKTGRAAPLSLQDVQEVMAMLRGIGVKYGVAFPQTDTPQQAKAYLVRWGVELLH